MINVPNNSIAPYAATVRRLLRGPIYYDQTAHWTQLLQYAEDIKKYLGKIGVVVIINETDGYAYLTQQQAEEEEQKLPALLRRRPLSWEVTLLCVLLREKLDDFDMKDLDARKLILTRGKIKEEIELFFQDDANRSRLLDKLDSYINRVRELGYLDRMGPEDPRDPDATRFEVKRILKARFTPDELDRILKKLTPENESASESV